MAFRSREQRIASVGWWQQLRRVAPAVGLAAVVGLSTAGCIDNEHGANHTPHLQTMPDYPVGPTYEVPNIPGPALPEQAPTAAAWICNKLFYDMQSGQLIVRPATDSSVRLPLHVTTIDQDGAQFASADSRSEFKIINPDGSYPERQTLDSDCSNQSITVRTIHPASAPATSKWVAVDQYGARHITNGNTVSDDVVGAVCNGLVSEAFHIDPVNLFTVPDELVHIEDQLAAAHCS